jgi:hypothetical protein
MFSMMVGSRLEQPAQRIDAALPGGGFPETGGGELDLPTLGSSRYSR